MINTLRQTTVMNDILLSKKQKLFLHYHPISMLNHINLDANDELLDFDDMNKEQLKLILENNNESRLLEIDQKLIEQLIGKKSNNRQLIMNTL